MSLPDVIRQRQDVTVTDANTGNRRVHERLPAGLLRRVTFGGRESVCQLYCLSEGGAQIGISNGWAPFEGTALSLWLSGDDEIKGRVSGAGATASASNS